MTVRTNVFEFIAFLNESLGEDAKTIVLPILNAMEKYKEDLTIDSPKNAILSSVQRCSEAEEFYSICLHLFDKNGNLIKIDVFQDTVSCFSFNEPNFGYCIEQYMVIQERYVLPETALSKEASIWLEAIKAFVVGDCYTAYLLQYCMYPIFLNS